MATRCAVDDRELTVAIHVSALARKSRRPVKGQRQGRAQGEGEARQEDHAACFLIEAGKSAFKAPLLATSIRNCASMGIPFDFQLYGVCLDTFKPAQSAFTFPKYPSTWE